MAYNYGVPGYNVDFIPEQEVKAPGASAKIDAAIRKGILPNSAGGPAIDPNTGMAKGVRNPVSAAPKVSTLRSLGGGATLASVPSLVMAGAQQINPNIPDAAVAHPLEFIGAGLGQAYARNAPTWLGGLTDKQVANADKAGISAYQGTRFDVNAPVQPGANIIPEAAADIPRPANVAPTAPATQPPATQPPANTIPNPATPEQQQALGAMGITTDKVVNPGAGVDLATANQIERQGRYGGKDGMLTQLAGYGDQNSIYARASRPGGKINEFYGAGTGKASNPASMGINVIPAAAMMQPETRGPGPGERAAVMERNIAAAEASGDFRAANMMRAERNALTAPKDEGGDNWLRNEYRRIMDMPTNTFGDLAAKRAAMAMLNKGIKMGELDTQARVANASIGTQMQKAADEQALLQAREALGRETFPGITNAQANAVRYGVVDPFSKKEGKHVYQTEDVARAFGTPALDEAGKPIIDPMTGKQAFNPNKAMEREFASWMVKNGYKDTNEALPKFMAMKASSGQSKAEEYARFKAAWDKHTDPAARASLEAEARRMGLIR